MLKEIWNSSIEAGLNWGALLDKTPFALLEIIATKAFGHVHFTDLGMEKRVIGVISGKERGEPTLQHIQDHTGGYLRTLQEDRKLSSLTLSTTSHRRQTFAHSSKEADTASKPHRTGYPGAPVGLLKEP